MADQLFSVSDQIVVVSGGSRGIGLAIAVGFAERGAQVIVTGRQPDTLREVEREFQHVGRIRGVVCDVSQTSDLQAMVDNVLAQEGRIDTLVNVAGVNRRKPSTSLTREDYDYVMNINLTGAYELSVMVARDMIARGSGCQINVTSLNNDRPLKNVAPYAMSKAALGQMTRALALEWSDRGVRVNGLAPGFILTDLTHKLWSDPKMLEWGIANTPQRRLGVPQDLVGTAIFLAAPASAFMTGQILYVDGGFTAGWNWPIP